MRKHFLILELLPEEMVVPIAEKSLLSQGIQRLENIGLQLVLLIKPWFGGLSRICLLLFVLQASSVRGAELVPAARLPADSAVCDFFLPVS